jgi:hypothetical protein
MYYSMTNARPTQIETVRLIDSHNHYNPLNEFSERRMEGSDARRGAMQEEDEGCGGQTNRHGGLVADLTAKLNSNGDSFLLAAAEAGLFPPHGSMRTLPEGRFSATSRISLTSLVKKPYTIRAARVSDLEELLDLELQSWDPATCHSRDELLRRVQDY